jgi:DNA-directed RNA polymerase subunit RPC12/RpoP
MIKIIEKEKDFDGRCVVCGTVFTYKHSDLQDDLDGYGYVKDKYTHVKCPQCGSKVYNIWHNYGLKSRKDLEQL